MAMTSSCVWTPHGLAQPQRSRAKTSKPSNRSIWNWWNSLCTSATWKACAMCVSTWTPPLWPTKASGSRRRDHLHQGRRRGHIQRLSGRSRRHLPRRPDLRHRRSRPPALHHRQHARLGIGTSAQAHLAFAMRNLGYGSDVNGIVYHADDIINETLRIEDGYILPPPGPGLGVSLNPDKVEKYRIK